MSIRSVSAVSAVAMQNAPIIKMNIVKILNVVGARPNFMKMAPIIAAINRRSNEVSQTLVHTGQHYDERMSEIFFVQLGLPRPDVNLGVGSGTQARQTAEVMVGMEEEFTRTAPALAADLPATLIDPYLKAQVLLTEDKIEGLAAIGKSIEAAAAPLGAGGKDLLPPTREQRLPQLVAVLSLLLPQANNTELFALGGQLLDRLEGANGNGHAQLTTDEASE